jgi:glycosyltransferase involved in cell wall biosynthesis
MRLNVCFIGLKCYDFLSQARKPRDFGGTERQQMYIGQGLTQRGHQVSFVTFDYGQEDGVEHNGIKVYKAYARKDGLPGVRFFHPRWSGLSAALKRADADLYFQMGADSETGQVADFCRRNRRAFVFATASDSDCARDLPRLTEYRRRWLYRYGLRRADAVIAQAEHQRLRLRQSFSVDATVIRNCTPDPGFDPALIARRAGNARPRLIWIGRFAPVKRLEVLLELAARRPDMDFEVAGAGDPAQPYVQGLEKRAVDLPNVTLHGAVFGADLNALYERANLLICTSQWEGLPNVFLEAWARGLPVVSTVDPDGMIERHGLGAVVKDPDHLGMAAQTLLRDPELRATAHRARSYYLANYTVDISVGAFEALFTSVQQGSGHGRGRVRGNGEQGRLAI